MRRVKETGRPGSHLARRVGSVALALCGIVVATGAAGAQQEVELRRSVAPGAYVKIWAGAGTVDVEAWERDSILVTGTRTSRAGRFFQSVGDSLAKVGFYTDAARGEVVEGELRVRVPASATVWIKVTEAAVSVRGIEGSLDVFSVSGSVDVGGSPRTVYVESMAGRVDLGLGEAEVVRVKGGRGDVTVRGRILDLEASTVDGAVDVRAVTVRRADLESIGGRIAYHGGLERGGRLTAETHDGDVDLVLPPELGASFDLATVEGEIDNRMGRSETAASTAPERRQVFETGAGEAEVEVRTFSGTLRIRTGGPEDGPGG